MDGVKHAYLALGLLVVILLSGGVTKASGQAGSLDIVMSNMDVTATLYSDCTTSLVIDSEVANVGGTSLDYFDLRIDVRRLNVTGASLNGTPVITAVIPESNYNLIRITSPVAFLNGTMLTLSLNMTADCLQEEIGLSEDETMFVNHLIYYIRPLYEVQNLTFTAVLPTHAILQTDAAAPLFPIPTMNYTDGFHPVYVWFRESIHPGQEVAYIVKYQIPAAIIQDPPSQLNAVLIGGFSLIVGAIAVLFIERIPMIIDRLRTRTVITPIRLSKQEEQVLRFLSKKGGSSPQREIYEELDMSQSLASTVLSSLEEQGLIKRLKSGRENIVHLMEE